MINQINSIYENWNKMPTPGGVGKYQLLQFQQTNLWVLKNFEKGFGFLITDTFEKLKEKTYKNLKSQWKSKLSGENGVILNHCLIIEASNKINSELFCSSISLLFNDNTKNKVFSTAEILQALNKLEEITKKRESDLNEIIGVWGELYLINELLKRAKNEFDKKNIIESWEGADSRSEIDFNFIKPKLKIEVKTTTESIRKHHFNSLGQLEITNGAGFLASFCIKYDDFGKSCKSICESINNLLPKILLTVFEKKIKIRGEYCLNNIVNFSISESKGLEFFNFQNVPKPIPSKGVIDIEWTGILENIAPISSVQKENLFQLEI